MQKHYSLYFFTCDICLSIFTQHIWLKCVRSWKRSNSFHGETLISSSLHTSRRYHNRLLSISCILSIYCLLVCITMTGGNGGGTLGGRGLLDCFMWWTGIVWNPQTEITSHWPHPVMSHITPSDCNPWPVLPDSATHKQKQDIFPTFVTILASCSLSVDG